jgi:HD superfamily phosphohydrolase
LTSKSITTKNPLKFVKQIYDAIHGSIGITQVELKVIDTPVFQRLHRIMQLGPAYYVYPGATHSRFAHSLGAMHVMNQYLENVTIEGQPIIDHNNEEGWRSLEFSNTYAMLNSSVISSICCD